jgi:uncharacterized membrane protein YvbJ
MYCPQCGTEKPDIEQFCTKCGYESQINQVNQPPQYQNPQYPQHKPFPHEKKGASAASLVCGIIGLITAIGIPDLNTDAGSQIASIVFTIRNHAVPIVLSIISIVMGFTAKKHVKPNGNATAGIVLSIIAVGIIIIKILYIL